MKELNDEERVYVQKKTLQLLKVFRDVCEAENIWYSLAYGTMLGAVRHKGFIPWDTDADVFIMLPDKEKFRKAFKKHKPDGIRLLDCSKESKCLSSHDFLLFEKRLRVEDVHLDIFQLVGAPSNIHAQNKFARYACFADMIVRSKYVDIKQVQKKNKIKVAVVKIVLAFVPDKILKRNIYKREYRYLFETSKFLISISCDGKGTECIPKSLFEKMTVMEFCGESFAIPRNYKRYLRQTYGDDYMTPIKY